MDNSITLHNKKSIKRYKRKRKERLRLAKTPCDENLPTWNQINEMEGSGEFSDEHIKWLRDCKS